MTHGLSIRKKATQSAEAVVGRFFRKYGFAKVLKFKVFKYLNICKEPRGLIDR